MCGIAGWISNGHPVDASTLERMRDTLAHRGPDGRGLWLSGDRQVGLVHRRLAIIDLSTDASQPMRNPEENTVIVFNGEIYNHRALRRDLEQAGVRFSTDHSDTEVLLRGYSHWGMDELLRRINGMFAFVIYDGSRDAMFVVRDRVGIKPLYYAKIPNGFLFASEIKSLLEHPGISRQLNSENFWHFLMFRSLPAPLSLFTGVEKMRPGTYLRVDCRSLRTYEEQYWDPAVNSSRWSAGKTAAEDRLEELLIDSVKLRLEADTDVGVFLSGGLDSTYILNLANNGPGTLSTFTAAYGMHPAYDEGQLARRTANESCTRHHEVDIDDETYMAALVDVAYYQDEPIAAPVCVPVYLLSEAARIAKVPVVLAGEGSDEVFIGYQNWIRIRRTQQLLNALPALVGKSIGSVGNMLAQPFQSLSRPAEFARRAALDQPLFWGGAMDFTDQGRRNVAGGAIKQPAISTFDAVIKPFWQSYSQSRDPLDVTAWMTYIDVKFRLPELMLPRLDKMGMAFSIEGRVPFLDHRIIEFVMGLPPSLRANTGTIGKPLFKTVASRRLAADMVYQAKRGFQAPVKEWKESAFRSVYLGALTSFARRTELFDVGGLQSLLAQKSDRLYFSLVNFMLWYSLFIENVVADHLGELRPRIVD